ncbi:hypothetical protein W02_21200 [Nitrospira sp. KM1]|uniref:type IV pilus modification PilV family protein n=1 Tax=Nitrospira sp. KM1 TaxID=1936990 RepID=UPI0013A7241F|nr:choice-of-anchor X domain-containing protein [Nitrospira sp. KM1]BCA54980.1 hypothetical protein W02_21200 [Nitrospira sp. KM1]
MTPYLGLGSLRGASFSEVLIAMALIPIALVGAMGAFHTAEQTIGEGVLANRALAMAESRIEAKRAAKWDLLLVDDLNYDGIHEIVMHDDGQEGDLQAADGVYSARKELDNVLLTWSVSPNRTGPQRLWGYVVLQAQAQFGKTDRRRAINVTTIRSNPSFVGQ